jgi:hypothetical protein
VSANAAKYVETNGSITATPRAPYVRPDVEALGSWSALTMQLSIPISLDFGTVDRLRTERDDADGKSDFDR